MDFLGNKNIALLLAGLVALWLLFRQKKSLAGSDGFGVHPIYVMVAIGFGSKFFNWMNDSGFWVVSRFSGLTQTERLRSWTILVSLLSIFGLLEVLLVSKLFPMF